MSHGRFPAPRFVAVQRGVSALIPLLALLASQALGAASVVEVPPMAATPAVIAAVPVLALRPTQLDLGMVAVAYRIAKLEDKSPRKLQCYLDAHSVPVVIGPQGFYLIDRHHLVRAAYEMGIKRLPIIVKHDYSDLGLKAFWERMEKKKLVDLLDQFGERQPPSALAGDVTGLTDSPARSVATVAREEGAFLKTKSPFAENNWARFFQENLTVQDINHNFNQAVQEAKVLSKSPLAASLPGYRKPRQRIGQVEINP